MTTTLRFGCHVRIRHSETLGVFKGVADRKHAHVHIGSSRRVYPLADLVEVQAPAGGARS